MRYALVVVAILGVGACKKEEPAAPAKPPVASTSGSPIPSTAGADGVRTVQIEAGNTGYVPERIPGKPGEKLKLVFTRTVEGECLRELKTPDGKLVELPMRKPVEIAVTVPTDGEVKFACGMEMFFGVIVAEKS